MLLQAFGTFNEGVYLHSTSDGKLFNIARLKAKIKKGKVLARKLLFANDAALVSHTESVLQSLVDLLPEACFELKLKIILTKN